MARTYDGVTCPECGGRLSNLQLHDFGNYPGDVGTHVAIAYTCRQCGAEFEEVYRLQFEKIVNIVTKATYTLDA